MVLVDTPKNEDKDGLEGFQKENLFQSIVTGKDVVEKIKTSRGTFEIKFPRTKDLETIGRLKAYRLSGISEKCFDVGTLTLIHQIATLDVIVRSGAAWYENAKKENGNFSWGDVPSVKFIQEVYGKAEDFRLKVQKLLDEDPDTANKGLDPAANANDAGSTGVFAGITSDK